MVEMKAPVSAMMIKVEDAYNNHFLEGAQYNIRATFATSSVYPNSAAVYRFSLQ